MEHNKLFRANAGRTKRLPRLITQVEFAFVHNKGFIDVPKQTCLLPCQHATPYLPKAGIIGFNSFLMENFSSGLPTLGNYPLFHEIYRACVDFKMAAREST